MFFSSFNNGARFPFPGCQPALAFSFSTSWNYLDLTFKHTILQDTELRWGGRCCWWRNERSDINIRVRILSALMQQHPGTTINIARGPQVCLVASQGCKSLMLSDHHSPWRTPGCCMDIFVRGGQDSVQTPSQPSSSWHNLVSWCFTADLTETDVDSYCHTLIFTRPEEAASQSWKISSCLT